MGLPAVVCGVCFRPLLLKPSTRVAGAFCCGALAVALSGILFALALAFSGDAFLASAGAVLLAHIPVMGIEGMVTVFIVSFLARSMPDVLRFSSGAGNAR